jgi:hypothetical protein
MRLNPVPNGRNKPHKSLRGGIAVLSSPAGTAPMRTGSGAAVSSVMVRVIVRLRPERYDELFRHVREIGSR